MSEKKVVLTKRELRKVFRKATGVFKTGRGLGLESASTVDVKEEIHRCTSEGQCFDSTPQVSSSFQMSLKTPGIQCSLEGKFPNLVILDRNNGKTEKGLIMLKRNFLSSPYGPISVTAGFQLGVCKFEIQWKGETLVTGQGQDKLQAEYNTCVTLLKELRKTNYFIEAKKDYWPGYKHWPESILNPDSSNRHIRRVVCLKNKSLCRFPFSLTGDVDYVLSEDELWQYVEDHGCSNSNADLFIFNIEKQKHKIIKEICAKTDMVWKHLLGCSNLGICTSRKEDPLRIKRELLLTGGENIKYRLIPPGTEVESMSMEDAASDGENESKGSVNKKAKLEEIEISQWIGDHLILMDMLNERSYMQPAKEILFCCVRDCPDLEEFIIEKKLDEIGLVKAEALIDRKLVGRAQAFKTVDVKRFAAEDALNNLKKACKYIEIKESYSGRNMVDSQFLIDKAPGHKDEICWVASRSELSNMNYEQDLEKLLKRFKNASVEDLFFLRDFEVEERMQIFEQAKTMGFPVRKFGQQYVCVYKNKRPKDVYKQLLMKKVMENQKYKLILPKQMSAEVPKEVSYANLFDIKEEKNDEHQWENQRGDSNRSQEKNENRNQDINNRHFRHDGRDSKRSCDQESSYFSTSRQHQISPQKSFRDQGSSSELSLSRCHDDSHVSHYDTGSSRHEFGTRYDEPRTSHYESSTGVYDRSEHCRSDSTSRYRSDNPSERTSHYGSNNRSDSTSQYKSDNPSDRTSHYGSDGRSDSTSCYRSDNPSDRTSNYGSNNHSDSTSCYRSDSSYGSTSRYANRPDIRVFNNQSTRQNSQQSWESNLFTRRN